MTSVITAELLAFLSIPLVRVRVRLRVRVRVC